MFVWDVIIYPYPNCYAGLTKSWDVSFTSLYVITYPYTKLNFGNLLPKQAACPCKFLNQNISPGDKYFTDHAFMAGSIIYAYDRETYYGLAYQYYCIMMYFGVSLHCSNVNW